MRIALTKSFCTLPVEKCSRMNRDRAFPILWALLLLNGGAQCEEKIPTMEEPPYISEAKTEGHEIMTNLQDLKSSFGSLSETLKALDTRVRDIETLVKELEVKTTMRMDAQDIQLQEFNSKIMQEGQESRTHEQAVTSNLLNLDRDINSTIDMIHGMEGPVAEVRNQTRSILKESREEGANKSAVPESIDSQQKTSGTAVSCELHESSTTDETVEVLTGAERDLRVERMLKDPKATFYTEENLTGGALNYDSNTTTFQGGCQRMEGIESMRMSESCVRVFKGHYCRGISRALYPEPGSGSFINFLTPEFPDVKSVGPCLPNEFQFSTVSLIGSRIAVTKDETKVREVPDFVDFSGWETFRSTSTEISSSTNPVSYYYIDQGRPKWIRAFIYKRHLSSNAGSASGMNMAIPPELGGPMNQVYNTFNQTQKNFEEWKRITDEVVADLKQASTDASDTVTMTFVYDTASGPDPYGFYYWINANYEKFVYGFIEN